MGLLAGCLQPVSGGWGSLQRALVFGWLIYGYFLQRDEFRLQREELHATRETVLPVAEVGA